MKPKNKVKQNKKTYCEVRALINKNGINSIIKTKSKDKQTGT